MTTNLQTAPVHATTFESLGVPAEILAVLARINFTIPTPIQEQAIPMALGGTDILGSAQTGTGKTAAFTIPMLAHLLKNPLSMALIVAPTRELATQISQAVMQMTTHEWKIRCALLIGGDPMQRQMHALQQNPRIIIGTPGRINDHLKRRSVNLSKVDYLVLDETDRMLDMGFGIQIDQILTYMPGKRQTMLFSATLPPYIIKLANKYMRQPERIAAGSTTEASVKITQETLKVAHADKYATLTVELEKRGGTVIVFVKTKHGADRLASRLERENFNADAIHGDLRQNKRDRVIKDFRAGKTRILVATDVAARGLDIPHIEHVINYDLPQCPEDYIHRIGRTGRNGAEGFSLSFISNEDGAKWNAIQRLMNPGAHANEDRPRGNANSKGKRNGGGFKGGFKHKRKEWQGPNRHRRNDEGRDQQPTRNEGRYQEGSSRPHESRSHEPRTQDSRPQRENRENGNREHRGNRENRFEGRDNNRAFEKRPENRHENRGEVRSEGGDKQRPWNRDRKPKSNRPQQERKFERPSYGNDTRPKDGKKDGGDNRFIKRHPRPEQRSGKKDAA